VTRKCGLRLPKQGEAEKVGGEVMAVFFAIESQPGFARKRGNDDLKRFRHYIFFQVHLMVTRNDAAF
jgi:hypothetical protein